MYYFKLVHCGVVVTTTSSRYWVPFRPRVHPISSPSRIPLFHGEHGWHSLGSCIDYRKVKELLMLGDSSSKGTISVRFGSCWLGSVTWWEFSNRETKRMESHLPQTRAATQEYTVFPSNFNLLDLSPNRVQPVHQVCASIGCHGSSTTN